MIASALPHRAREGSSRRLWFSGSVSLGSPDDSTLQRMYRHFNFRLCDVVDTAALADAGAIDFANLRSLACAAGIWEGVATYLQIVSDYTMSYRGTGLDLPKFVKRCSAVWRRGSLLRPGLSARSHRASIRPALWIAIGGRARAR